MPTTLTDNEKMAIYEILEVPQKTSYQTMNGLGSLTAATDIAAAGQSAAYTALATDIAALVDPQAARVQEIAQAWNAKARLKLAQISNGNVGNLSQVTLDYEGFRDQCKKLIKVYLPWYTQWEAREKMAGMGGAGGANLSIGLHH